MKRKPHSRKRARAHKNQRNERSRRRRDAMVDVVRSHAEAWPSTWESAKDGLESHIVIDAGDTPIPHKVVAWRYAPWADALAVIIPHPSDGKPVLLCGVTFGEHGMGLITSEGLEPMSGIAAQLFDPDKVLPTPLLENCSLSWLRQVNRMAS